MTEQPTAPRRVRVTSPRSAAGRPTRVAATTEIDAQTRLGEVYMSSLLHAQARLAVLALVAVGVLVGGIPLFLWLFPALVRVHVLGVPLPWLLLGFGVYPFLLTVGWLYVRAAERNERDFTEVLDRP
jgi:hypothetical protein